MADVPLGSVATKMCSLADNYEQKGPRQQNPPLAPPTPQAWPFFSADFETVIYGAPGCPHRHWLHRALAKAPNTSGPPSPVLSLGTQQLAQGEPESIPATGIQ